MSALDATDAVWNRLKTIPGVGPNVYNYVPAANTDADFKQFFIDATDPANPFVHAWSVSRAATDPQDKYISAMSRTHMLEVSGFRGFKNGVSERLFQQEIEDVCSYFDSYADGSARRRFVDDAHPYGKFDWSGPMKVVTVRTGMLGNYLVHAVLLNYPVCEFPL